jgi:SprB repeat/CHU_C Type IX secretion signal domain
MMKHALAFVLMLSGSVLLEAQAPANDECNTAIAVPNSKLNFCSANAAYTNVNATPSTFGPATCFGTTTQRDVWFTFVPKATDMTVTVRGATQGGSPGGTLRNPQVAVYIGNCSGTINQVGCESSTGSSNVVELYEGGLLVGSTYLIRVQGAAGQTGTFQLCINNYNPPAVPTSDCPTASPLCDKSSFSVKAFDGAGKDNKELEDAVCFQNGSPGVLESNSTWFVWKCEKSGSLEFTLTPNNAPDDLDFVLYRLPNGPGNCQGKTIVRCMASGDNKFPSPCMGPTGLRAGDTDNSEDAGCTDSGDNAWLAPFNMVAGETYALAINNFSPSKNGFTIDFGGVGEFQGPEAKFTTAPAAICLGTAVSVTDASTFSFGTITDWQWSFGADAVPQTATGKGPHNVQFNTPGDRSVVLTVKTNLGCKVTDIQPVKILPDVELDTLVSEPDCNGATNGVVEVKNVSMGTPPYQYKWNNGPFQANPKLSNVGKGLVNLVVKDANNCETELAIQVNENQLKADAEVKAPLCTGDKNGTITMKVLNGNPPFQFDWGSGLTPGNSQSGFGAGVYTIQGVDATTCKGTFTVTVTDNPPVRLTVDSTSITCFGANNGAGKANPTGGVGGYTYRWSSGQTAREIKNLNAGQYLVTVADANGCLVTGGFSLREPGDISVRLVGVKDLPCFDRPEGEITLEGVGGRPPYTFSANGASFVPGPTLKNLAAGDYWVRIKDAGGCIDSVFASVNRPLPLTVQAFPKDTVLDLGNYIDLSTVTAPPGSVLTFEWTPPTGLSDPKSPNPALQATKNQVYLVEVSDPDGCTARDSIQIRVNRKKPVYAPNVIKPGSGEGNDRFTLYGNPAAETIRIMRVFDRWGTLVYEAKDVPLNDPQFGWDGTYKGQKIYGVFAFYATVRFINREEEVFEGSVTVLR